MKAARLNEIGQPLTLENLPDPTLLPGSVVVRIHSSHVLSFTGQVMAGKSPLQPPVPYTPGTGAIGTLEAVASDVNGLRVGQRVFCDPNIVARTNTPAHVTIGGLPYPETILSGWFPMTSEATGLLNDWKNGSLAEKTLYPAEAVTPIDGLEDVEDARLAVLSYLAIAYGGLLRAELKPGQTLVVNGATGNMGVAATLVALAMGAGRIVAVGREKEMLARVAQLDSRRIVTVAAEGTPAEYGAQIVTAAGGADAVVDVLGNVPGPEPTMSALKALRPGGTAVFMGGVMADLPISYPLALVMGWTFRGAFMYPRSAPGDLVHMITAGTLDLSHIQPHVFALDQVNEAVAATAKLKGFDFCMVNS